MHMPDCSLTLSTYLFLSKAELEAERVAEQAAEFDFNPVGIILSNLVDKKSGTNSECVTPSGTFKMGNN